MSARWPWAALAGLGLVAALTLSTVRAAPPPLPYRLWWSFPKDDESAIEIDESDLSASAGDPLHAATDGPSWDSRWQLALALRRCDQKRSRELASHRDNTPVREVRIDALDGAGAIRASSRCVMTLRDWRRRLGAHLVERLEDALDAHLAFLLPRRHPGRFGVPDGGTAPAGSGAGAAHGAGR